jgi:hypothetical protein
MPKKRPESNAIEANEPGTIRVWSGKNSRNCRKRSRRPPNPVWFLGKYHLTRNAPGETPTPKSPLAAPRNPGDIPDEEIDDGGWLCI